MAHDKYARARAAAKGHTPGRKRLTLELPETVVAWFDAEANRRGLKTTDLMQLFLSECAHKQVQLDLSWPSDNDSN